MDKQQLAKDLRIRQYKQGIVTKELIDTLSDDDIIKSYITCSSCGKQIVTDLELRAAVTFAHSTKECLALIAKQHKGNH